MLARTTITSIFTGTGTCTFSFYCCSCSGLCCPPFSSASCRSTYATVYRDNLCAKEEEFVRHVRRCVEGGGKVLIPLFAVGRAQELCILLHQYWEQVGLEV